jgi:DNA-binding NarL/FixJ family response regulator
MIEAVNSAAAGNALLVCKDEETRELLVQSLRALAIRSEICEEVFSAAALIESHKFEAVIVDLKMGEQAAEVMERLRHSPANRTAVSFVVTSDDSNSDGASDLESTFVLARPLSSSVVSQTLRAAYGLIVRERRRYFRCVIAIPAMIRTLESPYEEIPCNTINISEGGIAAQCRFLLKSHIPEGVRFRLPGHSAHMFVPTTVRWRNDGDLVGLEFQGLSPSQKSDLQEWLARRLEETLPESVAALFRSVSPPTRN